MIRFLGAIHASAEGESVHPEQPGPDAEFVALLLAGRERAERRRTGARARRSLAQSMTEDQFQIAGGGLLLYAVQRMSYRERELRQ